MAIRNCWGRLTFFLQDHETFFGEALQKWKELNCTVDFSKQLFTDEEALLTFILCVIELCRLFSLLLKFLLFGIKTGRNMEKHGRTEKFFLLLSLQLPSSKKFETWQAVCPSFYTIRYFTSRYVTVTSWLHHCCCAVGWFFRIRWQQVWKSIFLWRTVCLMNHC